LLTFLWSQVVAGADEMMEELGARVDFHSNLLVQLQQELIQSQSAQVARQILVADITEITLYSTQSPQTAVEKVELVHHKMVELVDQVELLDITQLAA
jgi:hypothetical protein